MGNENSPLDTDSGLDFPDTYAENAPDDNGGVPDGRYHVQVLAVSKTKADETLAIKLTLSILAGTVPNCQGRHIIERIYLTPKAMDRARRFFYRLGLIPDSGLGKSSIRVNFSNAVGCQAIVEVENREFKRADGSTFPSANVTFNGIWKLDDPEVAGVPKAAPAIRKAQGDPVAAIGEGGDPFDEL
jgi:hypothetical protein